MQGVIKYERAYKMIQRDKWGNEIKYEYFNHVHSYIITKRIKKIEKY